MSDAAGKPNVLLAVAGPEVEAELVTLACGYAKQSKGKVYVVHVVEVPRTLPLDADMGEANREADAVLSRLEDAAQRTGCTVEAEIIQAREAGQTLVEEALDRAVGLVILGLQHRAKYGKFYLGQTVPHVLANAPCRVWVVRAPMENASGSKLPQRLDQLSALARH